LKSILEIHLTAGAACRPLGTSVIKWHWCVKTVRLLADNGGCVRHCGHGRVDKNGRCTSCDGACPKSTLDHYNAI